MQFLKRKPIFTAEVMQHTSIFQKLLEISHYDIQKKQVIKFC